MLACSINFSCTEIPVCCDVCCACVDVAVGDTVTEDEVVCEIETDKVVFTVLVCVLNL